MNEFNKICTQCKINKPLSDFYKRAKAKDGKRSSCIVCEKNAVYQYQKNNDRYKEQNRAYKKSNPDKIKKTWDNWYAKNKQNRQAYGREYRKNNPADPVKKYESKRDWMKANPEKVANYVHRRRALKISNGIFLITDKELKKLYNSPCFECGARNQITIDHIIPIIRGGRHSIGNIMPLCKPCNFSKNKKTLTEWRKYKNAGLFV